MNSFIVEHGEYGNFLLFSEREKAATFNLFNY